MTVDRELQLCGTDWNLLPDLVPVGEANEPYAISKISESRETKDLMY